LFYVTAQLPRAANPRLKGKKIQQGLIMPVKAELIMLRRQLARLIRDKRKLSTPRKPLLEESTSPRRVFHRDKPSLDLRLLVVEKSIPIHGHEGITLGPFNRRGAVGEIQDHIMPAVER
jgi:hypothetical protein